MIENAASFVADPLVEVSAIVTVSDRFDDPLAVGQAYLRMLESSGRMFEIVFVLDGPKPAYAKALDALSAHQSNIHVVKLNRPFGEAACLSEAIKRARGSTLLLLPAYLQVAPESIGLLLDRLDEADVVTAARDRSRDRRRNRMRGWGFKATARLAGFHYDDPGCLVRAVRRRVFDELVLQDGQHRFLPLLAERLGFTVEQVVLPQAASDQRFRAHGPLIYISRILDLVALGFLMSFIQKPFRFFGTVGAGFVAMGIAAGVYMIADRELAGVSIADRPMLLLMALFIVLGIQIGAVGLIAEIVIFTRHRNNPSYRIDRIVESGGGPGHEPT